MTTKAAKARALKLADPSLSSYAIASMLDMSPRNVRHALQRGTDPRLAQHPSNSRKPAAEFRASVDRQHWRNAG